MKKRMIPAFIIFLTTFAFAQNAPAIRVAILKPVNTAGKPDLEWVGDSLGPAYAQAAASTAGVLLVERDSLEAIMQEIELAGSGLLDEKSAVTAGGLQGADYLLLSSYVQAGTALKISLRLVSVADGTAAAAFGRTGPLADLFSLEEALSAELSQRLAGLVGIKTTRSTADASALLDRSRKAGLAKEYPLAAAAAREYLALKPGEAAGLKILLAALDAGEPERESGETGITLDALVIAEPFNADWRERRAYLRKELGDNEGAGEDFTEAFRLAAGNRDIADGFAVHFAFALPDTEKTALALERAVKAKWGTPTVARFRALHGAALNAAGETEEAIKALSEALSGGERTTWVYEGLGLAQLKTGKPKDAAKSLEEAAKLREKAGTGFDRFWIELLVESLVAAGRKADAEVWKKRAGLVN